MFQEPEEDVTEDATEELRELEEPLQLALGGVRDGTSAEPSAAEQAIYEDAMAFAAGYVAYKCHHIDPGLGVPMHRASAEELAAVPSTWLQVISRGRLYVPSVRWMEAVRAFDLNFKLVMGATASKEPGIVKRLMGLITTKDPQLDDRVARKLASTRLHFRLRTLNTARKAAADEKRAANQLANHAASRKV